MKAIIKQFFLHGVGKRFFNSELKLIFNNKTLKKRHTKSMIIWIFQNKNMSIFQKFYRIYSYVNLLIALYFRRGFQYRIVCSVNESCSADLYNLIRNVELLMKKGYLVLIDLYLPESTTSQLDFESRQALVQLINLLNQQKALKCS